MVQTSVQQYQRILVKFFRYIDGADYDWDHSFTAVQLNSVTDLDVVRYMNVLAFGRPDPEPDANPTGARSSTIAYVKKAISYFIPNNHMQWNEQSKVGNPTRSKAVNQLLLYILRKEVRRQGRPSKARRPMTAEV